MAKGRLRRVVNQIIMLCHFSAYYTSIFLVSAASYTATCGVAAVLSLAILLAMTHLVNDAHFFDYHHQHTCIYVILLVSIIAFPVPLTWLQVNNLSNQVLISA